MRHQVLVNTSLLLLAGHETTINLICNGTLAFIQHPDQWALLQKDPAGAAKWATEECLRYDAPVKSIQRIASQDLEMRGKTMSKDDRIRWFISSANRDPNVFADPDRFDITRQPNPHWPLETGFTTVWERPWHGSRVRRCSRLWPSGFERRGRVRPVGIPSERHVPLAESLPVTWQ
jgi:cytochrome P450